MKFVKRLKLLFVNKKPSNNKTMNVRFFYGPHMNHQNGKSTWAKLYVLTQDGTLYCEYLNFMNPSKIIKSFNYSDFKPSDYSYGEYQHLKEITYEEAITTNLTQQPNWVNNYLKSKGLL